MSFSVFYLNIILCVLSVNLTHTCYQKSRVPYLHLNLPFGLQGGCKSPDLVSLWCFIRNERGIVVRFGARKDQVPSDFRSFGWCVMEGCDNALIRANSWYRLENSRASDVITPPLKSGKKQNIKSRRDNLWYTALHFNPLQLLSTSALPRAILALIAHSSTFSERYANTPLPLRPMRPLREKNTSITRELYHQRKH